MRFPGFIGPSYTLSSIAGDCERLVNFFIEPVQSGFGKSPATMRGTPGLSVFATCASGNRNRGMIICYGVNSGLPRVFTVSATTAGIGKLYEINSNGSTTDRGTLSSSSWEGQAWMAYNESQLAIAFGPQTLFIFTFSTNVLTQLAAHAVTAAAVQAGGAGYVVGDLLPVVGGVGDAAVLKVETVSAGAVLTVSISNPGAYSTNPTNPVATTGGSGTSADFITAPDLPIGSVFVVEGVPYQVIAPLLGLKIPPTGTGGGATFNLTLNSGGIGVAPTQVVYLDGYFICNSSAGMERQRFYISSLKNGLSWDLLDFEDADAGPDILVSILAPHGELWILGQDSTQPYFNSGNADFPFETIKGQLMEGGCGAPASAINVGDSSIWLSHDVNGRGLVVKADGYRLTRISTYAVEQAIRSYSGSPAGITDAVAWTYQDQGHVFYVLTFPTANKTWSYDLTTGLWNELMKWTGTAESAHLGISCVFAFWETTPYQGKLLVGARNSGKIYEMSTDILTEDSDNIRRIRRCPHLASEGKRNFYNAIEVELETGLATNQRLNLRWSDNGGKTYCAYKERNVGPSLSTVAVTAATVVVGGSAYTLNDLLTVVGGDGTAATIRATGVTGGVITAVTVITGGAYTGNPANPVSVTGGTGSGATFNLTIPGVNPKRARWLRPGMARDKVFELMVDDPVKWCLTDAFIEMEAGYN